MNDVNRADRLGTKLGNVAITARPWLRALQLELIRLLRQDHDCQVHLYCALREDAQFYEKARADGLIDSITVEASPTRPLPIHGLDPAAIVARAQSIEDFLDCTYNYLAVADRHFGRAYALGGFYHPRSRQSETTGYHQFLHTYSEVIDFWRRQFEDKRIALMLNGPRISAITARRMGIAYRTIINARHADLYHWTVNEFQENPSIERHYHDIADAPDADLGNPYESHMMSRKKFLEQRDGFTLLKKLGFLVVRQIYWHLRGFDKAKGYYLSSSLQYVYRNWRDARRLTRRRMPRLTDLEGQRFVYFPLHTEPETALQMLSPEYFYQLSAIAAISRDLPAGCKLVVKETFAGVGRRPDNFYRQIADFKNVVLIDMLEIGLEVVRRAEATVTISGTGGFEAAVLGKPVIVFGRHNNYRFLPHVMTVTDEAALRGYLRRALDGSMDPDTMRRDGARYLAAVKDTGFDLGGYDYFNSVDEFDPAGVERAYESLINSLDKVSKPAVERARS